MPDWRKLLEQHGPNLVLGLLAGGTGGLPAASGYLTGRNQRGAYDAQQARQAELDAQQAQAQQFNQQQVSHESARRDADAQQAQFARALQLIQAASAQQAETAPNADIAQQALGQQATSIESGLGMKPGSLGPMVPNVAPQISARDKKRAQDIVDRLEKSPQYKEYLTSPEGLQQLDNLNVPWTDGTTKKVGELRQMVGEPTTDAGTPLPMKKEPKLQIVDLGGQKQVMDLNTLQQGQTFAETANPNSLTNSLTGAGTSGGLTPEGIDYAATQYRVTGQMPPLGMASAGARAAVVNAAAQQAKALQQSPAVSIQKQAAYKSDQAALTKMRSMSSAAESFETKALAQADIVAGLSQKVDRTQLPFINDALLAGKARIAGDQNTQLLFNALTTFSTEYAKIMEGSTGSVAASSDASRQAAARLISAGLNKGTLQATLDLMKREMRLTISGYDATIDHITGRMGGAPMEPAVGGGAANDPLGLFQ